MAGGSTPAVKPAEGHVHEQWLLLSGGRTKEYFQNQAEPSSKKLYYP